VIAAVPRVNLEIVAQLPRTRRGGGGFGHTGTR
jgi:dUTPase